MKKGNGIEERNIIKDSKKGTEERMKERKKKREAFASLQALGEPSIRSLYSGYQIKTSLF